MKIEIYYLNGRYKIIDTANFVESSPFRHDNLNQKINNDKKFENVVLASQFDFRLEQILDDNNKVEGGQGLILLINYYVTNIDQRSENIKYNYKNGNANIDYFYSPLRVGRAMQLLSSAELNKVSRVVVDGNEIIWRINDRLMSSVKFNEQKERYLLNEQKKAFCDDVFKLWAEMDSLPEFKELPDKERKQVIAAQIGLDNEFLDEIIQAQVAGSDEQSTKDDVDNCKEPKDAELKPKGDDANKIDDDKQDNDSDNNGDEANDINKNVKINKNDRHENNINTQTEFAQKIRLENPEKEKRSLNEKINEINNLSRAENHLENNKDKLDNDVEDLLNSYQKIQENLYDKSNEKDNKLDDSLEKAKNVVNSITNNEN